MEEYLTKEMFVSLEKELKYLKEVKREEVIKNIDIARSYGDLSENSEYEVAKNEQGVVESRIRKIEVTLQNAKIIKNSEKSDMVIMGSKVQLEGDSSVEYTIVGVEDANIAENKISNESPIGVELLGKKKGDKISLKTPKGVLKYSIKGIK